MRDERKLKINSVMSRFTITIWHQDSVQTVLRSNAPKAVRVKKERRYAKLVVHVGGKDRLEMLCQMSLNCAYF